MTFYIIGTFFILYFFVPVISTSIDSLLGINQGSIDVAVACTYDSLPMYLDNLQPDMTFTINDRIPASDKFLDDFVSVAPFDKIKVFHPSSDEVWQTEVPCIAAFMLNPNFSQDINTSSYSNHSEDIAGIDYGSGGMILPELDESGYDFENLDELDLDI